MINLVRLAIIAGLISVITAKTTSQQLCWTEWFDRDNPSGTGDWELLTDLLNENPKKICANPMDIEAQTLSGLSPAAAGETVQMDKDTGFVCLNTNQTDNLCNDYRVRFACYAPYCAEEVCWTPWFDRDDASGTGDWETLSDLHKKYPGKICRKPKYIEAVTVIGNVAATTTGQNFFIFNPTEGFVCKNTPCQNCKDYKVRFGCCCDWMRDEDVIQVDIDKHVDEVSMNNQVDEVDEVSVDNQVDEVDEVSVDKVDEVSTDKHVDEVSMNNEVDEVSVDNQVDEVDEVSVDKVDEVSTDKHVDEVLIHRKIIHKHNHP